MFKKKKRKKERIKKIAIKRVIIINTSKNQSIDKKIVIKKDIGMFVIGCPPMIALIALKRAVNLLSPGALSNITPLTYNFNIYYAN